MVQLTNRQQAVYDFIRTHIRCQGFSPTVREICAEFDISSPNGVVCHLKALEKKGRIQRIGNKSRAIALVNDGENEGMPVNGSVAAGAMQKSDQINRIDFRNFFDLNERYVLEIQGDSMIDAQIIDGDYVIIEPGDFAKNGQIVVVRTYDARTQDDETTLKYYFRNEDGTIDLKPANKSMSPIRVRADEVEILGIVVGVMRSEIQEYHS